MTRPTKHFLVASDFDQTLSFNDSGAVLSELIGASRFTRRSTGLARSNLVQQGGELAYLIRHDPGVPRRPARAPRGDRAGASGCGATSRRSSSCSRAASTASLLVLRHLGGAARGDPVGARRASCPPDAHLRHGARLRRAARAKCARCRASPPATARSPSSRSSRTGWASRPDRTIYIGDGSSDVHVMLHVNNRAGFTIAVSENRQLCADRQEHGPQRRRVERDGADARAGARLGDREIRSLFESYGLTLHEWEKARTDRVTFANRRLP